MAIEARTALKNAAADAPSGIVSGAILNTLANYYLVRLTYEHTNEKRAVPEFNLSEDAAEALFGYLEAKYGEAAEGESLVGAGTAFELGLRVAAAIIGSGFDAEEGVKSVIAALSLAESYIKLPVA